GVSRSFSSPDRGVASRIQLCGGRTRACPKSVDSRQSLSVKTSSRGGTWLALPPRMRLAWLLVLLPITSACGDDSPDDGSSTGGAGGTTLVGPGGSGDPA